MSWRADGASAATPLRGTLRLVAGSCSGSGSTVSGTYLRMILPSGTASGPYMSNSDSTCRDQSYTPLGPGADGGLVIGSYQPQPNPPFDAKGNARAGRVTAPAPFYGTAFATSTNSVDPQTRIAVPAPQVSVTGTTVSADLRSFAVTWNNQYFNQGSPKPDGSYPGNTRAATGTFNPSTHAITLNWTSQVVGGPFDKFTGQWHLAGTFLPASATAAPATATPTGGQNAAGGAGTTAQPAAAGSVARAQPGARAGTAAPAAQRGSATPGAAVVAAGAGHARPAASTSTVTREHWHVAWWLVGLAVGIAVAGFGVLVALQRFAPTGTSA